jgi:hypothetical protein
VGRALTVLIVNHLSKTAGCLDSDGSDLSPRPRKIRKALRHRQIDLAPERHHQFCDALQPFPSPAVEFRRLAVARGERIDLVVASGKAQREPFLLLAAELGR